MPPRHASSQRKTNGPSPRKASRVSTLRLDSPPPAKKQKLRPLSFVGLAVLSCTEIATNVPDDQLSQPPVFDFGDNPPPEIFQPLSQKNRVPERSRESSQTPLAPKPNGEHRAQVPLRLAAPHICASDEDVDDQLWIDRYAPQSEVCVMSSCASFLIQHTVVGGISCACTQSTRRTPMVPRGIRGRPVGQTTEIPSEFRGYVQRRRLNRGRFQRILVLTGPAGTAKTTTVQLLARELGFDIKCARP